MLYQTTRHLWLQNNDHATTVSNVCTGRRAFLNQDEIERLEHFTTPQPSTDDPLDQRLIDADLIVAVDAPANENPRSHALLFALDKFLSEERQQSRSRLKKEMPDINARLDLCRDLVVPRLKKISVRPSVLSRRHVSEDFEATIDHVRTFLTSDATDAGAYPFSKGFLSSTAGRPLPRVDYEQQPCLPHTTQRRIRHALPHLGPESRGLILGDDDLLSLYWSQNLTQQADVFELDTDLIAFLQPQLKSHVKLHQRDLTNALPEEFHGRYDAIFTDPMYEATGMDLFLKCCAQGLSDKENARVYFSTRPDLIQKGDQLHERLRGAGLALVEQTPNFNRYPFADFVRRIIFRDYLAWQAPMQLIDGLLNAPYLYADLFELRKSG